MNIARCGIVVALLIVARAATSAGQIDAVTMRLVVPSNETARSELLELSPTLGLSAQLEPASAVFDGAVRVYVFDANGVLAQTDDPEQSTDVFRWAPPKPGRYRAVVTNTNSVPVIVNIRSTEAAAQRGGTTSASGATVRVWFATNRALLPGLATRFGTDPSNDTTYGYSEVGIPRDHRMGELEAPSIWRLDFREDPQKHVSILKVEREMVAEFFGQVGDRSRQSPSRQVLVFVHGFDESFEDAVKRTAQIAYDLAFDGPAIVFSWPSQGRLSPLDYTKDQRNADVSAAVLAGFLSRLHASQEHITVHVIAHSMGNRVLARALENIAMPAQSAERPLREVVMMAPDIDAELFRQAAGKLGQTAQRVTLYASSQDLALRAAQRIAGYARAGEGGSNVVVVKGIDTIDASAVQTGTFGLGHSYYADNTTILSDLFGLIRGRRPDERFGLEKQTAQAGVYWRFRPAVR